MIYGKLTNLSDYKGINTNLDIAIDFILENDLNTLPLGITRVKGEDVFINVMVTDTKDSNVVDYEVHKNHFDIFIPLLGMEKVEIGDEDFRDPTEYNEASDIFFVNTHTVSTCILDESNFIIVYSNEPHKPSLAVSTPGSLKKAVVKILK